MGMWSTFLVSYMTTFERQGVFKLEYCNNCITKKKYYAGIEDDLKVVTKFPCLLVHPVLYI